MRIAVSGTHAVGKSTLVEALADALPGHDAIEEPYHQLADDLVVFVPIEDRDRIALPRSEDAHLRRAVDERLRALLVDGELGAEVDVVEVTGSVAARVAAVVAHLRGQ